MKALVVSMPFGGDKVNPSSLAVRASSARSAAASHTVEADVLRAVGRSCCAPPSRR
jgi:hypothetical protein